MNQQPLINYCNRHLQSKNEYDIISVQKEISSIMYWTTKRNTRELQLSGILVYLTTDRVEVRL